MIPGKHPKSFICFELEEGAFYISYLNTIVSILSIAAVIAGLFMEWTYLMECSFLILIILDFFLLPIYGSLIRGTKKQDLKYLSSWLLLHGIWAIFASLLTFILIVVIIANVRCHC